MSKIDDILSRVVTHPTILFPIEYLWGQGVSLSFLLLGTGPHEVPLLIHARRGYVHLLNGYPKALQDHQDSVLAVGDLRLYKSEITILFKQIEIGVPS